MHPKVIGNLLVRITSRRISRTQIEAVGANGGLVRYKLRIEPWTTFLTLNRDSALYQDMTVLEIFDSLFNSYQSQGRLAPAWRLDLADARIYPQRSLTTQHGKLGLVSWC